jgi:hypothetical protein
MRLRDPLEYFDLPQDLASQLKDAASQLEIRSLKGNLLEVAASRRQMVQEFERLVDCARAQPQCEHFLKPLPFEQLCSVAEEGPVVLLVAGETRAEAIVLGSSTERATRVILPIKPDRLKSVGRLTTHQTRQLRESLLGETRDIHGEHPDLRLAIQRRVPPRRDPLEDLLSEVWRDVVHPIVQILGLQVSALYDALSALLTNSLKLASERSRSSSYMVDSYRRF